jgi:hypothetical protein
MLCRVMRVIIIVSKDIFIKYCIYVQAYYVSHGWRTKTRSEAYDLKRHFKSAHIALQGKLSILFNLVTACWRQLAGDSSTACWRQLAGDSSTACRRQLDSSQLAGDSSTARPATARQLDRRQLDSSTARQALDLVAVQHCAVQHRGGWGPSGEP